VEDYIDKSKVGIPTPDTFSFTATYPKKKSYHCTMKFIKNHIIIGHFSITKTVLYSSKI